MEPITTSTLTRERVSVRVDEPRPMTPATQRPRELPPIDSHDRTPSRRIISEGRIVFLLAFGSYLAVAILLDFKYHVFPLDAFTRMANGFDLLYSRDPHLAAIGFVWEPLQSFSDMLLLLGNHLWPALSHNDMAGSLVSALGMAGAAYQILMALREWGVSRLARLLLTAFFVVNPMVLYYGGNGMSEGLYLFTVTAATRYLLRWMRDGDLRSLAYSGVALAFCYLTRNEAALGAVLGGASVGAVSYWRAQGSRKSRIRAGASDLVIFVAPAFTAIAGWAFTSYIIVGAFVDGGALSTRLANQGKNKVSVHSQLVYQVHAIGALAPFLPILLVVAVAVALWRRDPRVLALSVLAGALAFDMVAYMGNAIAGSLRYWIVSLPLGILLLGSLVAAIQTPRRSGVSVSVRNRSLRSGARALTVLAVLCLVLVVMTPTTILSGSGMLNPQIGTEESTQIGFIFGASSHFYANSYPFALAMGRYFVNRHLPDGDVIVDNSTACIPMMIVASDQPKLFVIPNDRDFQRILADPLTFHTHYVLVPDPETDSPGDVNFSYSTMWSTGDGFTKMVHQFPSHSTCPEFRLFHVVGHPNAAH